MSGRTSEPVAVRFCGLMRQPNGTLEGVAGKARVVVRKNAARLEPTDPEYLVYLVPRNNQKGIADEED